MAEIQEEIPIKAESITELTFDSIFQTIFFYYFDAGLIYHHYHTMGELSSVLDEVQINMQNHLNDDKLFINNQQIDLHIINTKLEYDKDNYEYPILVFTIENDTAYSLIRNKTNILTLDAEDELAEYPIHSLWKFPDKVSHVQSKHKYKIQNKNEVLFSASIGSAFGGKETISFFCK